MRRLFFEFRAYLQERQPFRLSITARCTRYAGWIATLGATALIADTLVWWHVENRLRATVDTFLKQAASQDVAASAAAIRRSGWPFGAALLLSGPELQSATPRVSGIAWAGDRAQLGGSWVSWLQGGTPFTLQGSQVFRVVFSGQSLTLTTTTLHGRIRSRQELAFRSASAQLSLSDETRALATLTFDKPSGKVLLDPAAGPEATRLGIRLSTARIAAALQTPPLNGTLNDVELALALAGSRNPASLLTASGYSQLLLQYGKAVLPGTANLAQVDLSARLSMPDLNGTATVRLFHWQEAANMILDLPAFHQAISGKPLESLRKLTQYNKGSSEFPATRPIILLLPVRAGMPIMPNTKYLSIFTRMFDAPHSAE